MSARSISVLRSRLQRPTLLLSRLQDPALLSSNMLLKFFSPRISRLYQQTAVRRATFGDGRLSDDQLACMSSQCNLV